MIVFFFNDLFIVSSECLIALPECKGIYFIDIISVCCFEKEMGYELIYAAIGDYGASDECI